MPKYYTFVLIFLSFFISSQELNEDFLNSLPDDIRDDVMQRMIEKNDLEKKVYRNINTSSDLVKFDNGDDVYGSQFFKTIQTTFMPINSPNLDDTYVLDFGDILTVQLIGQKDTLDSYPLSRDGSINIPDIGKLYIAGLSLAEASEMINARVQQTYIGVDVYTSLENIRDISILVSGDAYNPGVYTLNGSSNMLHALHAAGGISKHGSYREIKLIRDEKIIDNIDIYDILINGKFGSKKRLRSGDIIFVEPRANVVTLEGAFKRNHKYELLKNQNISDAIYYANGVNINADLSNIFLYRLLDGEIKDIPISSISQFDNIKANHLDRVFVRKHSFRDIRISGAVLRPGNYKMVEGDNIFNLIDKAGGYTPNAFPEGAIYLTTEAKKINDDASKRLYKEFIEGLLEVMQKSSSGETDITSLVAIAQQLKQADATGRIIIDLKNDTEPTIVKDQDSIHIPEKTNNLYIFGEVLNEGSLIFKKGANIDFYLNEASGLKDSADDSSIFVLYPNGRTQQFSRKRNLFASQSQNILIQPGSVIYVPRKIDTTLSNRLTAQAYATILGNIGLSLASISSINNNK